MYRDKDLQNCLFGLVGFRQNDNPQYPKLPASLLESDSGLYFQDEHPLINIENIDQAFKNYDAFPYTNYSGATSYALGAQVRGVVDATKVYESLQAANQNHEPSVSPLWWKEVPLLAQKLEQIVKAAGSKILARVFTDKKINQVTKAIFDNVQLFDGAGSMLDKEIKAGRFVGFQIVAENHRDVMTVIKRLGTQFSQANPAFKLYVYHSSQEAPIRTYTLNLTGVNSFQWTKLVDGDGELYLRYLSETHAPGGVFYIGYYEGDLVGQAINKGHDFSSIPCSTCNRSYSFWTSWSRFITVTPFEVPSSALVGILPADVGGPKLWDIGVNQYQYTKNYGLNLDLTTRCDITDFICSERHLLADALLKQVTVDILSEIANSTRNNVIAKETRDLAFYALGNRENNTPGAETKLERALKAVSFDLSDLNEACLPCNDKGDRVSWGTVG
jgi:hypothetical protein